LSHGRDANPLRGVREAGDSRDDNGGRKKPASEVQELAPGDLSADSLAGLRDGAWLARSNP